MQRCDVAVIGSGPYGLSLAAHLRSRGVDFRIFGKPMDTWRAHMPKGMMLKSEGFASNLSAPDATSTLKCYCKQHGVPYADRGLPIKLSDFIAYADWFRARHVPNLEETKVSSLRQGREGFVLQLNSGETLLAGKVVLAVGVSWFPHIPDTFSHLPGAMISHSYDHRTVDQFKGREVVVLGAGASAINLAYELEQAGCTVKLLARAGNLRYNTPPNERARSFWHQLRNPPSPIGQGWRSHFCAKLPQIFYHLPASLRARAVKSHVHAAGGWYMRDKVEGRVPQVLGREIARADLADGRIQLELAGIDGERSTLTCDHVIAATGYRVDVSRMPFLDADIRSRISDNGRDVAVSAMFETDLTGLYTVGMTAMDSFGPLLRFMVGSRFAAPRLALHLRRRIWIEGAAGTLFGFVDAIIASFKTRARTQTHPRAPYS
jgi:FAD-dependent urate hydroxylase